MEHQIFPIYSSHASLFVACPCCLSSDVLACYALCVWMGAKWTYDDQSHCGGKTACGCASVSAVEASCGADRVHGTRARPVEGATRARVECSTVTGALSRPGVGGPDWHTAA